METIAPIAATFSTAIKTNKCSSWVVSILVAVTTAILKQEAQLSQRTARR